MPQLLSCLLVVLSLCACTSFDQALQNDANPRYHPFPTYASGGGGSR